MCVCLASLLTPLTIADRVVRYPEPLYTDCVFTSPFPSIAQPCQEAGGPPEDRGLSLQQVSTLFTPTLDGMWLDIVSPNLNSKISPL